MVSLEVNDAVVLEQKHVLEAALSTNPKTEKALQKLIRKALMQARASMEEYVKSKLDNNDPRSAARAIRTSVYRKILGGNMNILNGEKGPWHKQLRTPTHTTSGSTRWKPPASFSKN